VSPTPPGRKPTAVLVRRFVAYVVDGILAAAAGLVTFFLLAERQTMGEAGLNPDEFDTYDTFAIGADRAFRFDDNLFVFERRELVIVAAVALGFTLLHEVLVQGRTGWTLGKALTGIRTVNRDGERPGILRALGRFLLLAVDHQPGLPLVGMVVALASADNRRVGDLVAGTYVVRRSAVGEDPTRADDDGGWTRFEEHPGHVTTLAQGEQLRVGDAAPEPEPEPDTVTAPAATKPAGGEKPAYQPQWDPARKAYLQWDPRKQVWLQFDDDAGEWRPAE